MAPSPCHHPIPMHPLFARGSGLTETIIGAAIEVHRDKGPGLLESVYEWCLLIELGLRGLRTERQRFVDISYKGHTRQESLKFDVLVEGCVLIEAKAVERVLPIHKAQLFSYMKLMGIPIGIILNFNVAVLVDGVSRLILPGANSEHPQRPALDPGRGMEQEEREGTEV